MSRTLVHSFSISLDGFGTGEDLSAEAPFGHAGHRLHDVDDGDPLLARARRRRHG